MMLSAKELAKKAGVTLPAITAARQKGRIHGEQRGSNWFYSEDQAAAFRQGNPQKDSLHHELLKAKVDRERALAKKEKYQAELAKLDLGQRKGELLLASEVEAEQINAATLIRNRLLGIPSALAPQLAAMVDPAEIQGLLDAEIRQILTDLATAGAPDRIDAPAQAEG